MVGSEIDLSRWQEYGVLRLVYPILGTSASVTAMSKEGCSVRTINDDSRY